MAVGKLAPASLELLISSSPLALAAGLRVDLVLLVVDTVLVSVTAKVDRDRVLLLLPVIEALAEFVGIPDADVMAVAFAGPKKPVGTR